MPTPHTAPLADHLATAPPDLSTVWLRTFLEVARHGSFTVAARELGWTQSAVSRQIAALEAALGGAPLFDRLPRGVRPTAHGRALLPHAQDVLSRLRTMGRELAALRDAEGGLLRVGAFATADAGLVPRAIATFRARHPGVTLTREEGLTPTLLSRLTEGELDVAVVSTTGGALTGGAVVPTTGGTLTGETVVSTTGGTLPGDAVMPTTGGTLTGATVVSTTGDTLPGDAVMPTTGGTLTGETVTPTTGSTLTGEAYELHHLLDETLYVALPAGHALAASPELRLPQLAAEDWISGSPRVEGSLLEPALRHGFRPRVAHAVAEWTAKQGYVAAGLGITLVPALAAEGVRRDITLVPLRDEGAPPRTVYAATPRDHAPAPATRPFLTALRGAARGLGRHVVAGRVRRA
ncbi:LysR substrate-binding domain-containing protein [Streptomyces sp. NPDC093510]|uniref:LysR family transcriptional regulator n=1 Tax=Streptomyces sp. NPDC093510 TaxID=3155199 RepID=UPI00342E3A3F